MRNNFCACFFHGFHGLGKQVHCSPQVKDGQASGDILRNLQKFLGRRGAAVETPPNILGFVDDLWFHYVTDMGNAGPDKGKGGKFLFLPPDYQGPIPDGYFVSRCATFGNWIGARGLLVNGDPKACC